MRLDLEALLHDVLDDPKTFFDLDLQNAKLVAIPNFDPRNIVGTDVNGFRCMCVNECHVGSLLE